ncbi:hypothetical protein ABIE60_001640 [Marinobacterium sp. MBR-109]|jgi:hypothetical protein
MADVANYILQLLSITLNSSSVTEMSGILVALLVARHNSK